MAGLLANYSDPTCIQAAGRMPTPPCGITIHARLDYREIAAEDLTVAISRAGGEVLSLDIAQAIGPYVLAFPGIFRGALDCGAREINEEMLAVATFDVIITDPKMPNASGIDLCYHVKKTCPSTAVVVMSGATDSQPD